ncbi:MAG: hypothetical protein WBB17_06380 [Saprospiraceae bacterium]|nr:hypothetical protein [Saprospiraceae bacterium]MBK7466403.1 hypothetical protein [Saprospiraceae bacterium]
MRITISILMSLSIITGFSQSKILTFSTGRSGGTANLYFNLYNNGFQEVNVLAKDFDPYIINFGMSSQLYKFLYLTTKLEIDRMNGDFTKHNDSPNPDEYTLLYFSWNNVGLNLSLAPECRLTRKYFHLYTNAGLNQRMELVNLTHSSKGLNGTSFIDLSGSSVPNKIRYSFIANCGINVFYKKIGLNFEIGYRKISRSLLIPGILDYKLNTLHAIVGICYSF